MWRLASSCSGLENGESTAKMGAGPIAKRTCQCGRRGLFDPFGPADIVAATGRTGMVLEVERRFTC